jgi:hypothetical protein
MRQKARGHTSLTFGVVRVGLAFRDFYVALFSQEIVKEIHHFAAVFCRGRRAQLSHVLCVAISCSKIF